MRCEPPGAAIAPRAGAFGRKAEPEALASGAIPDHRRIIARTIVCVLRWSPAAPIFVWRYRRRAARRPPYLRLVMLGEHPSAAESERSIRLGRELHPVFRQRGSPRAELRVKGPGASQKRRVLCVFPHYVPSFGTFEYAYPLTPGVKRLHAAAGPSRHRRGRCRGTGRSASSTKTWAPASADDFAWADAVFVSGMHIQRRQMRGYLRPRPCGGQAGRARRPFGFGLPGALSGFRLSAYWRTRRRDRCADRASRGTLRAPPGRSR